MIFVTGDTHRLWMERLNSGVFPEQAEMTKEDYIIICGDFGIWDGGQCGAGIYGRGKSYL